MAMVRAAPRFTQGMARRRRAAGPVSGPRPSWPTWSSPTPRPCWPSIGRPAASSCWPPRRRSTSSPPSPSCSASTTCVGTRYARADGRYTGGSTGTSSGPPGSWPPSGAGRRRRVSTWPRATPTPTASSTSRCCGPWAIPTPSTPTAGSGRGPPAALARRALGPSRRGAQGGGARALPPAAARRPPRVVSLRPLRHRRHRAHPRRAARSSWPPTTAATSTWSPWPSWPPGWAGPCGSWPSASSSTPRGRADRPGPRRDQRRPGQPFRPPLRDAQRALEAGEVVVILPQGTIPRGEAFFDPVLKGKTGTARLAAMTGAPVVPIGLWGTEAVWPRSARVPDVTDLSCTRRHVRVRVGTAGALGLDDAVADTAAIMAAIVALLPDESPASARADGRGAGPHLPARTRRRRDGAGGVADAAVPCGPGWPVGRAVAVSATSRRLRPRRRLGHRRPGGPAHRPRPSGRALAAGRQVALVSGTNGKTTTTHLLAAALGGAARVATSSAGCQPARRAWPRPWPSSAPGVPAVLEVDEGYLGAGAPTPCTPGGGPAQPVARPARPGERGPHGGRPLAARPRAWPGRNRGRQRR